MKRWPSVPRQHSRHCLRHNWNAAAPPAGDLVCCRSWVTNYAASEAAVICRLLWRQCQCRGRRTVMVWSLGIAAPPAGPHYGQAAHRLNRRSLLEYERELRIGEFAASANVASSPAHIRRHRPFTRRFRVWVGRAAQDAESGCIGRPARGLSGGASPSSAASQPPTISPVRRDVRAAWLTATADGDERKLEVPYQGCQPVA